MLREEEPLPSQADGGRKFPEFDQPLGAQAPDGIVELVRRKPRLVIEASEPRRGRRSDLPVEKEKAGEELLFRLG